MKTFNIISTVVFGLFTITCLLAGFHNPAHFIFAAVCAALTALALFDSSDEHESVINTIKKHLRHGARRA